MELLIIYKEPPALANVNQENMVLIMVFALLVLMNAILAMVHQEKRTVIHVILVSSTLPLKKVASRLVLSVTTQILMRYNAFKQSDLAVKFLQL